MCVGSAPNVIQKFVEPRSSHNHLIRCSYSAPSDSMKMARLTNKYSIFGHSRSLESRMATFENQAIDLVTEDSANDWKQDLHKSCREICTHVRRHCAINITSANFYFKIDKKNQVNLIFATCIRADRLFQCLNGERLVMIGLMAFKSSPTHVINLEKETPIP